MGKLTSKVRDDYHKAYRFLDAQTWCPKPFLWLAWLVALSVLGFGFALAWCLDVWQRWSDS
jgi:hypothetical protein